MMGRKILSIKQGVQFTSEHFIEFGENLFNGDVLILCFGSNCVGVFHHEGVRYEREFAATKGRGVMRIFPEELSLMNLRGEIPEDERGFMTKLEAYGWLKELSGKDFGLDIELWAEWVRELNLNTPTKEEGG